jgi:hypothetical protein
LLDWIVYKCCLHIVDDCFLPYSPPTPLLLFPPSPSALVVSLVSLALAAFVVITASVGAVASVVYL